MAYSGPPSASVPDVLRRREDDPTERAPDVLLGEEGRGSSEQITLHLQDPIRTAKADQLLAFGAGQARSLAGLHLIDREPVPQTRLADLQIPSQLRDRILAVAVVIELSGEFHGTPTELRRVRSRQDGPLPAASAADGRCPGKRGNSSAGAGRAGFGEQAVDDGESAPGREEAVGAAVVEFVDEGIEVGSEVGEGLGGGLLDEPAFEGLEAFDFSVIPRSARPVSRGLRPPRPPAKRVV
jgi:hypothetical protein